MMKIHFREAVITELTKREYFAAMAMQGMASLDIDLKDKVEASVQLADALIKELNK